MLKKIIRCLWSLFVSNAWKLSRLNELIQLHATIKSIMDLKTSICWSISREIQKLMIWRIQGLLIRIIILFLALFLKKNDILRLANLMGANLCCFQSWMENKSWGWLVLIIILLRKKVRTLLGLRKLILERKILIYKDRWKKIILIIWSNQRLKLNYQIENQ